MTSCNAGLATPAPARAKQFSFGDDAGTDGTGRHEGESLADADIVDGRVAEELKRTAIQDPATIAELRRLSLKWLEFSVRQQYSYNFTWLGRPIIQYPQDIVAIQEIIWSVKPDLVIETGIAHGGSLILSASILDLIGGDGHVLGIDIDIRAHAHAGVGAHTLAKRITMIEGSSVAPEIVEKVRDFAAGKERVVVVLDSMHTHDHVLQELEAYSPLVSKGSYLVVLDTVIEDLPADLYPSRPWGPGNNPKTAVREFLKHSDRFDVDHDLESKLLITTAPEGFLRCIKE
jgi:cephalosporin hydroxylase